MRYAISVAVLTLATLMGFPSLALAQTDACAPSMDPEKFSELVATTGKASLQKPAEGYLPLNTTITVRFHGENENRHYAAYVMATETIPSDPTPTPASNALPLSALPIESVVKDGQNTDVHIALLFKDGKDDVQPPKFSDRYTILVVGCLSGMPGVEEAPAAAAVFGSVTRQITGVGNGLVLAFLAFALVAGGIVLAVRRNREDAGSNGKALLSIFANYRNTVSLSSFQLFVFFAAIFMTVAYAFGRRWQLTDLSEGVLYLLGISAAGAVAGAWGDAAKERLSWENWRWLDRRGAFPNSIKDGDLSLSQLFTTRGAFDMYRFQALLFTLLVAPAFVITSVYTLGEASVPAGILAVLGLSQVTYLAGMMSGAPTVKDFDTQLTELRKPLGPGADLDAVQFHQLKEDFAIAMGRDWANPEEVTAKIDVDEAKKHAAAAEADSQALKALAASDAAKLPASALADAAALRARAAANTAEGLLAQIQTAGLATDQNLKVFKASLAKDVATAAEQAARAAEEAKTARGP